ncbi:MAG: hypothetical protein HC828_03175 [Blastochloris sp.]|nr:hypothetical protein [Blastochloris sp.]
MSFIDMLGFVQIFLAIFVVLILPTYFFLKERWQRLRTEAALATAETQVTTLTLDMELLQADLSVLEKERLQQIRTGERPMDDPPAGVTPSFEWVEKAWPRDPYAFGFGWQLAQGKPGMVYASVDPESPMWTGNMLLTAKTRYGKDMLAFLILWTLCMRNAVDRLRVVYIDGKESDGGLWAGLNLAHNLYEPVLGEDGIAEVMKKLRELRQHRQRQRRELRVTQWSDIPLDTRPPLVVVFVSELKLLRHGLEKEDDLQEWLTTELSSALASGILYIVSSQSVANMKTSWRDQCSTYIAGFQDRENAIEPNFGMYSKEIEKLGGVSPTEFAGPGYFTIRINRSVATIRSPKLSLEDRRNAINTLPRRPAGIVLSSQDALSSVSQEKQKMLPPHDTAHTNIPATEKTPKDGGFLERLIEAPVMVCLVYLKIKRYHTVW